MAAQSKKTVRNATKTSPIIAVTPEHPAKDPEVACPATMPADPKGKLGAIVALLRRPDGARIADLMAATGWQAHSVRGAMSGALKKKLGLTITSEKTEAGRIYQIVTPDTDVAA
jgi:hypothetical protein